MLLTIDIGNTQTVIGVYEESRMRHMWRVTTNRQSTADEIRVVLMPLFTSEGLDLKQIDQAIMASVVPQLTNAWRQAIYDATGCHALFCSVKTADGLFKVNYPKPEEVGSDRLADAIGARFKYGAPVIIVDFGTATNIEVVDADGEFIGGVIAPGVETGAQALFSHGAQLAATHLHAPGHAIGTSTQEAIQSGIVYGEAERVDGLIRRIKEQLGQDAKVVATGGLVDLIAPYTQCIDHIDPTLTLDGLRLIAESHQIESH